MDGFDDINPDVIRVYYTPGKEAAELTALFVGMQVPIKYVQ